MLISIIVPVFNGEKKIGRCLASLIAIKESDIEFIIVNDGSTDETRKICEIYLQKDKRIRLINQENAGVSVARNNGLKLATGRYVGFADADDEITDEFDEILEVLKTVASDFYAFDHWVQDKYGLERRTRYRLSQGKNDKVAIYNNFLTGRSNCVWNNIYQLDIIRENNVQFPKNMSMGEDCVFNAQYLMHCQEGVYIKKAGYKYYIDDNSSATNKRQLSHLNDFVEIYENFQMIYKAYDNLSFPFYCPYYIDKVYEILQVNIKYMDNKDRKKFRQSAFYHSIMKYKYRNLKQWSRKWRIRFYIYFA